MIDAIIGGAIAAVIGAVCYAIVALLLEHRREKAKQLAIVEALIIETAENLVTCKNTATSELWWLASFQLDAYHAYKGQFFFLPEEVSIQLAAAVHCMEGLDIIIRAYQSREAFKRHVSKETMPPAPLLIEQLEFVNNALRKWRWKHTHSRLSDLDSAIRRRVRNFHSIIRENSGLRHT
jgi:hypothetical protein